MSYRGSVIRLPVGILGLSGSRNPSRLQPGHFVFSEGVSLEGGLIQKDGGAVKLNSSALASGAIVVGGISYSPGVGLNRDAVFLANGSVLKDTGAGTFSTVLSSGLGSTRDPPPYFVMGGGEAIASPATLFLFSRLNQVRAVDGDGNTMAAITTPAADWTGAGNFPTFGLVHEGRLWGGGNASDPHRIYFSTPTDHQNFTGAGAGTLAVFPGSGEKLVGGVSFKGLLVLFKYPKGIYIVNTADPTPANWRVDVLTKAIGSLNQHCIVPIDNDILYLDASAHAHLLSATDEFGGLTTSDISQSSDLAEFVRNEVNRFALTRACGIWHAAKTKAIFAVPRTGSADNNILITAEFGGDGVRFLTSRRDTPISLWMRPDNFGVYKPAHGDAAGFVWLMEQDARNKDGLGYELRFETSAMDLSFADPALASKNKTGDFLEIVFESQGDWDLVVQVIWDGVPGPSILYSMGGNSAPLGSFTLDTDMLGSTSIKSIRKRIAGQGRRLQLTAANAGVDENVAISDFLLSFRPTDERRGTKS